MYPRPGSEINHPWLLPSRSWEFSGRAGNTQVMPLEGAEWSRWAAKRGGSSSCFWAMAPGVSPANDVGERQAGRRRGVSMGTKRRNSMEWAGVDKHGGRWGKNWEAGKTDQEGAFLTKWGSLLWPRDVSCSVTEAGLKFSWFPKLHQPPLPHFFSSVLEGFFFFFAAPTGRTSAAHLAVY